MNELLTMVKNKVVRFSHYREGNLYYKTEDGFAFPVPIADTGEATFRKDDKAIYYMRWIRRQLNIVNAENGKAAV